MSASATDHSSQAVKTAFWYLLAALFCALFGAIYELFSHGVYSFFMLYAFVFPLANGALPFLLICTLRIPLFPRSLSATLYHSGLSSVTLGSIVCGILEIYGTTNHLTAWYWIAGVLLMAAGLVLFCLQVCMRSDR